MNPSAKVSNESKSSLAIRLKPMAGIVLNAHSILNWERSYHAPLLGSAITMVFMLFWLIDVSVLSKLCILAIIVVILDFALPILNDMVTKKEWIEKNEQKFEQICASLAESLDRLSSAYHVFCQMKQTATKSYYGILLCSLLVVAWVGSLVHNLLLTYIIVFALVMYPGMSKQESFKRQLAAFSAKIATFISPAGRNQKAKSN